VKLICSIEAWTSFQAEARHVHGAGFRWDALWKRLEEAMKPLYASADPIHHAQVYEDATRFLVHSGYLPESMAP
jgi:hypothetical protein